MTHAQIIQAWIVGAIVVALAFITAVWPKDK